MAIADLVLMNGNIITMNNTQPKAQAIAIQNGKIIYVDSDTEIKQYIGKKTQVVNLYGKTVVPGFIDTHAHLTDFGLSMLQVDLRNVSSIAELQQKLRQHLQQKPHKGRWILGWGWDQEKLKEKRYPTRWDLDQVSPDNPVMLERICKNLCVVNTKALEHVGLTEDFTVIGGQMDKDPKKGELTGVLGGTARILVLNAIPPPNEEELTDAIQLACQKAIETGLTSVHWFVSSLKEYFIIQKLHEEGRLPLRVYIVIPVSYLDELVGKGLLAGLGNQKVKIGSVKILSDGSLGARTAALHQPYHDAPQNKGILLYSKDKLKGLVIKVHKLGFQLAIHAIGDKAIEMVLDAIEKALDEMPKQNHRHRIEHASVLNEKLIKRMKELEVIASVQPHFIVSDFWVSERVGKSRARWVYPFKTLVKEGVCTTGSSDSPIEPLSPLLGMFAAVSRTKFPHERISVEEALRLYTLNAAYASFEERVKGSIEEGKLADFIVLSHDPTKVEPEKIKDIEVEMTIVDGKIVFSRA